MVESGKIKEPLFVVVHLERETGLEPATFCMASRRSTAELLPLRHFVPQRKLLVYF